MILQEPANECNKNEAYGFANGMLQHSIILTRNRQSRIQRRLKVSQLSKCLKFMTFREGCFKTRSYANTWLKLFRLFITISFTKDERRLFQSIRWLSYQEGKKFRTYAQFKHLIKFEPYLNMVKNIRHRIMLTKFRVSAHDLEIEKGRYNNKPIKAEERYCKFCKSNNNLIVEDEFHFLMICPLYQINRDLTIKQVCEFFPNLTQINLKQQFV